MPTPTASASAAAAAAPGRFPTSPLDPSDPQPNWKGQVDGYEQCLSSIKSLLISSAGNGPEATLHTKCRTWVQDQYNATKFTALMQELNTGTQNGDLARNLKGSLLNADSSPKLQHGTNCWTWKLDGDKHQKAVDALEDARAMAQKAITALTDAKSDAYSTADNLFQQYFGNPVENTRTTTQDRAKSNATTKDELAQSLTSILGGLNSGHYVLCGQGATDAFTRDPMTAAFADNSAHNVTYVGDRFFRPADRTDKTTPPGVSPCERACVSGATLLHEASHQFAGTQDVIRGGDTNRCYGREACKALPGNYAAANADSLAMFVMDVAIATSYQKQLGPARVASLLAAGSPPASAGAAGTAAAAAATPASASSASSSSSSSGPAGSTP